jgi:hypothetical protein
MAQVGRSAVLTPTIGGRRVMLAAITGFLTIAAVVALVLTRGYTSVPFDVQGELAIGKMENGLGDQYTLTASRLTATWTLNRDADAVLRLGGGAASIDGRDLTPGCYSGTIRSGSVISLSEATAVEFVTPATDPSCASLP